MILLNTIKRELAALDIKPKKSLGQNFLINEGIYKKIVAALEIKKNDTIVEVGPGLGTLTGYLAESGAEIVTVEKDRLLAAHLKNKFKDSKNVTITEGDVLKFNPIIYNLKPKTYKIVGNIPYYLTSRLLRTILEKWPSPGLVVLMIQKEVAQRIVAKPPEMSLLAVSVQYYARPEIISYISAGSFYPSPKVDSAIIRLASRTQGIGDRIIDRGAKYKTLPPTLNPTPFFRVVRAGFRGKRKQLINNLTAGLGIEKEKIKEKLLSAGVDYHRRAETLSIKEWQRVTEIFS